MTPGRQWKFKRNCVIYSATKAGFSQRTLADVFAMPHSRIAAIVKEFRQYEIDMINDGSQDEKETK